MIDGRQCGPFELSQFKEAGIRPDTYVWCKEMPDWEKARDVADICRYFRRHLAGITDTTENQTSAHAADNHPSDTDNDIPLRFRYMVGKSGAAPEPTSGIQPDTSRPPGNILPLAVLLTLLCFPLTGFVAIYYSFMSNRFWAESQKQTEKAEEYRETAHEYARQAKMWTGITFFLGLILMAFIVRFMA